MRVVRVASPFLLALVIACGGATSSREAGRPAVDAKSAESAQAKVYDPETLRAEAESMATELEALQNLRLVGMDDGPVPDFDIESADGTEFDSSKLIGHQPFVVAFFATWCDACEKKLESLRRALAQSGEMLVIPVSVDAPETRERVGGYLRAVGMGEPVVYASDYQLFSFSYNPFNTIPLLVIVGKNGGLVDYQLRYELEHQQRLVASLKLAQVIPPLAKPQTN